MPRSLASKLPPGLPYTLRRTVINLLPAASIIATAHFLRAFGDADAPTFLVALVAIASIPVAFAARVAYMNWSLPRRAARMGAVLPPHWDGNSFGNRDILQHVLDKYLKGYPGDGFWDKVDELGHLHSLSIFWDPRYLTTDVNVIKTVLATDFQSFEKGEFFKDTMNTVLGDGVFNADGELWKFHRSMTRPYFSRDRISHFEMFDRHAEVALKKMKERFRAGHALDFQDLVSCFIMDSVAEFFFGNCVYALKSDLPYAHNDPLAPRVAQQQNAAERFSAAFAAAQYLISMRSRVGWTWRLKELFHDVTKQPMAVVDEYLKPILQEAIRKNRHAIGKDGKAQQGESTEDETLLDHLVKYTDDPTVLHDETLNIMIAGRDTTAATLSFAVYLLCMYPDVFRRLRAEVMDHIGPTQMPTFDDIKSMKYLRAVINETMRLYPVVPFNFRVAYAVFLMHHRKDYWGPDALYFDPDRFLDERLNKYFVGNPFICLPFNAGPRICLGQQFAYNEMSFILIRLMQHFSHMELDLDAQPPKVRPPSDWAGSEGQRGVEKILPRMYLTMYIEGGLWVKMTEAARAT